MQHDQIAQPRQIPAVAEIPPKHEHLPGGVDVRHVQCLLPQRDAEHAILPVLDKVVEPLPVHAVAPDRGTERPQGALRQRAALLVAVLTPRQHGVERVIDLQTIRPIGPERKQKHARRRDRQAPLPDAGNERIRRILLRRAGRQHGAA